MKKRKAILWIISIVFILTLALLYFFPTTVKKNVVVPLGTDRAISYIQNPELVKLWLYPFADADSSSLSIQIDPVRKITRGDAYAELLPLSMLSADLKMGGKKAGQLFNFFVIPDSTDAYHSLVSMTYKTTLLKKWLELDPIQKNAEKSLEKFQNFLSDTKKVYGFRIERILVEDTAFLFMKKTVATNEKEKGMEDVFTALIKYAQEKNAGYNGVRIFHSMQLSASETELFAGIGVTRRLEPGNNDPIQYTMMPWGKNLLAAEYEGPFGGTAKVYQALELYKKDNGLLSMAIPFQKFITEGYSFADTQAVKISVRYPVY